MSMPSGVCRVVAPWPRFACRARRALPICKVCRQAGIKLDFRKIRNTAHVRLPPNQDAQARSVRNSSWPARKTIIVNRGDVARASGQCEMCGARIAKCFGKLTCMRFIIIFRAANSNFCAALGELCNDGNIQTACPVTACMPPAAYGWRQNWRGG